MKVLVLNSGSSSQKSCLYEIGDTLPDEPPGCIWEGKIEWADDKAEYSIKNSRGVSRKDLIPAASRAEAIERLLHSLWSGETQAISGPSDIDVVGHRVVHGGPQHFEPAVVTAEVKSAIESVSVFAPLHNRAELQGMEIVAKLLGSVPQIAVFDTGFHRTMPLSAATYPGPYDWFEQGIRRYGFHGINHQYCAERAPQLLGKKMDSLKLVTCHLGNGCSLAAIREGRSVDTTMGFTPSEGLMMGTRSGSVDPGVLTYLMRQRQFSGQQLDEVLNKKSGLLGISGISSDMRQILAASKNGHERAKLAFEIYVHRLQSGIGAMIGVLGGVDALVFTAGVGENSPELRAAVCDNFGFLGLRLDQGKNAQSPLNADISAPDATVRVLVIHAQEDWMIARECWNLVQTATTRVSR
jgi:acetate kinase